MRIIYYNFFWGEKNPNNIDLKETNLSIFKWSDRVDILVHHSKWDVMTNYKYEKLNTFYFDILNLSLLYKTRMDCHLKK